MAALEYRASRLVRTLDPITGKRGGFGEGSEVVSARCSPAFLRVCVTCWRHLLLRCLGCRYWLCSPCFSRAKPAGLLLRHPQVVHRAEAPCVRVPCCLYCNRVLLALHSQSMCMSSCEHMCDRRGRCVQGARAQRQHGGRPGRCRGRWRERAAAAAPAPARPPEDAARAARRGAAVMPNPYPLIPTCVQNAGACAAR